MSYKLSIGLPLTDDKVDVSFMDSFIKMRKGNFNYLRPQYPSQNVADVRNELVKQAIMNNSTHLLMLDTDQVYPEDLVEKLIIHNLPIVGGKVHRRYHPYDPILYKYDEENKRYYLTPDEVWKNTPLVEVEATGTGCLMINMGVFDKLEYPWFKFLDKNETEDGKPVGEDIYFCRKAREANIPIYVDTTANIGHLALMEINEDFYFLTKLLEEVRIKQLNKNMEV